MVKRFITKIRFQDSPPSPLSIKLLWILLLVLGCTNLAAADQPITSIHIVSPVWENYTNEDGTTGLY